MARQNWVLVLVFVAASALPGQSSRTALATETFAITNVSVIPMTADTGYPDQSHVVESSDRSMMRRSLAHETLHLMYPSWPEDDVILIANECADSAENSSMTPTSKRQLITSMSIVSAVAVTLSATLPLVIPVRVLAQGAVDSSNVYEVAGAAVREVAGARTLRLAPRIICEVARPCGRKDQIAALLDPAVVSGLIKGLQGKLEPESCYSRGKHGCALGNDQLISLGQWRFPATDSAEVTVWLARETANADWRFSVESHRMFFARRVHKWQLVQRALESRS